MLISKKSEITIEPQAESSTSEPSGFVQDNAITQPSKDILNNKSPVKRIKRWMVVLWVAVLSHRFRVPSLILSLCNCLCGVSVHVSDTFEPAV